MTTLSKRILLLCLLMLVAQPANGQYSRYDGIIVRANGKVVGNQFVAICTQSATVTTQPCSPLATLHSSTSGGSLSNPVQADSFGNFHFYVLPGVYTLQSYGPQIQTPFVQTDISIGSIPTINVTNCTDVGINGALAALPSTGGVVDFSGCPTVSLASTVTTSAGQTLRGSLGTKIQATSTSLNPFVIGVDSHVRDIWFDCGNQPSYSGDVFTFNKNYRDGNQTDLTGFKITCSGISSSGVGILLSANGISQSVFSVSISKGMVYGLQYGAQLTAASNGFVNGVHLTDMYWSTAGYCVNFNNNNGQLNRNEILGDCEDTNTGVLFNGSCEANDQALSNIWIGNIWDATTAVSYPNNNCVGSNYIPLGSYDGSISDPAIHNFQLTNAGLVFPIKPLTIGPLISFGIATLSGCSYSSQVGGEWAGSFKSGTTGTCTVTISPGITAPNGWYCDAKDVTTTSNSMNETGYTTTTCTISGTTASSDVILWKAVAF